MTHQRNKTKQNKTKQSRTEQKIIKETEWLFNEIK
jgi:hypothetical protein